MFNETRRNLSIFIGKHTSLIDGKRVMLSPTYPTSYPEYLSQYRSVNHRPWPLTRQWSDSQGIRKNIPLLEPIWIMRTLVLIILKYFKKNYCYYIRLKSALNLGGSSAFSFENGSTPRVVVHHVIYWDLGSRIGG